MRGVEEDVTKLELRRLKKKDREKCRNEGGQGRVLTVGSRNCNAESEYCS